MKLYRSGRKIYNKAFCYKIERWEMKVTYSANSDTEKAMIMMSYSRNIENFVFYIKIEHSSSP